MKLKLIYLDYFESSFKDKEYVIDRFVDPTSLTIITGVNLNSEFEPYHVYECEVEWNSKKGKFKVVKAE